MNALKRNSHAHSLLAVMAAAALAGCGGGGGTSTSTLNLGLTDAPVDGAQKVWVQFTGVEVKPMNADAVSFTFNPARGFDLLTLQNGVTATFLNGATVPAGQYEWVRLKVDTTPGAMYLIDSTGAQHNLDVPSGAETGLKLIQGFTMPVGGTASFTIDFVLRKSIVAPNGQAPDYFLKPVLRMVDNAQVGTLSGTLDATTLAAQSNCGTAGHAPVVYLFSGNVTPNDIYQPASGTPPAVQPLTTTTAAPNASNVYAYTIAFVSAGTYTVAFTCDGDDPTVNETALTPPTLHFKTYPQPVTVMAGQTTTANF